MHPPTHNAARGVERPADMLEIPGMICLLDLRAKTVRGQRYLDEEARDFANLHGSAGLVLAPCTLPDPPCLGT